MNDLKNIEIKEVLFLTPAKIKAVLNGEEVNFMVSVDIINRKVYVNDNDTSISEQVFAHLDGINILPEDFFMASDEIRDEAAKAQMDNENIKKEFLNNDVIGG